MKIGRLALAFALAALLPPAARAANKLPAAVPAVLDKADEFELYSLDPSPSKGKDAFRGWEVLGKTTVKKGDRKAVLEALAAGIKASNGDTAKCFNPRHGIRATHDKTTVDLVICFECLQVQAFAGDDEEGETVPVTDTPQGAFDKVLTAAKVPLPAKK